MLIFSRVAQGVGAGGLTALTQVVMAAVIPPRKLGRYSGVFGAVIGSHTPFILLSVYMAVLGTGVGMLTQNLVLAAQNDVPANTLGSATSVLSFSRNMGGTVGTSVLGAVLAHRVATELSAGRATAGDTPGGGAGHGVPDATTLPAPLRALVENAYGTATAELFLWATPFAMLALIVVLFIEEKPLKTTTSTERLAEESAIAADGRALPTPADTPRADAAEGSTRGGGGAPPARGRFRPVRAAAVTNEAGTAGWPGRWIVPGTLRDRLAGRAITGIGPRRTSPMYSVVECDERPRARGAGLVVAPDSGGHGEDAPGDTDGDPLEGPSAVLLQVQLPLEGVVHGLDQLPHRLEQALALALLLRSATRSSSTSSMAWSTSRSSSFGFVSAHRIGIPVGVRPAGKTEGAARRRRFKEWTGARRRWPSSPCRPQWNTRSTNASRLPRRRSICCSTVRYSSMRPPGAAFFLPRTYNEQSRSAQM